MGGEYICAERGRLCSEAKLTLASGGAARCDGDCATLSGLGDRTSIEAGGTWSRVNTKIVVSMASSNSANSRGNLLAVESAYTMEFEVLQNNDLRLQRVD